MFCYLFRCIIVFHYFFLFTCAVYGQEYGKVNYPSLQKVDRLSIEQAIDRGITLKLSEPDSALFLFREAERASRSAGYSQGIGMALSFAGLVYTYKGDYVKGFSCYRNALPYCLRASKATAVLPCLYINMSSSYLNRGDYHIANTLLIKALQHLQTYLPGDKNIIAVYNSLCVVQVRLGNYRQALQYAYKAERLASERKIRTAQVAALINIGNIYTGLKMGDSSLAAFRKGLIIARAEGYTEMQQALLTGTGQQILERGEAREAIPYFEKAMQLSNKTNALYGVIQPGYSLGQAFYRLKNYKSAEDILLASISRAEISGLTENKQMAHNILSRVYEASGRYKEALAQRYIYEQLADSLTGLEKTKAISEVEKKYQAEQKDKIITQNALQIAQQQKKLAEQKLMMSIVGGSLLLIATLGVISYRNKRKTIKRNREIEQLKAMIAGEEKERARLARELHDGIGGALMGVKMNLKAAQKNMERIPKPEELDSIMDMLDGMGEDIRETAHNLMPHMLKKYGLIPALKSYLEQLDGNVQISFEVMGNFDRVPATMELPLYRIVQELVQNILKHASALHASVLLRLDEGSPTLCLMVEDDGNGFDTSSVHKGHGLENIEERVKILKGSFTVESTPGMGTTSYIEIHLG